MRRMRFPPTGQRIFVDPVADESNQPGRPIDDPDIRRLAMKKLFLAAMVALGLGVGLSSAYAATPRHYNQPQVTHWGPDYGGDAGGEA